MASKDWDSYRKKGKSFFNKVGVPVNKVTNKLGAEAFWPMSLDQESNKAARILRSFCIDGFVVDKENKRMDHIPPEVIKGCQGVAVFTVIRAGFNWTGAGGSGVVVARLPDGNWSPPSSILIHTLGWGLAAGADIYDCVCVINNAKGMDGFTRVRATLGGEVSASVGPLGMGGNVDTEVLQRQTPVWTYIKSKGLYGGIAIDGTIIAERTSENERFYNREGIRAKQILAGQVQAPQGSIVQLYETLQACEVVPNYNPANLPPPPPHGHPMAPGDHDVEPPQPDSHREYEELGHHPIERMDTKEGKAVPADF